MQRPSRGKAVDDVDEAGQDIPACRTEYPLPRAFLLKYVGRIEQDHVGCEKCLRVDTVVRSGGQSVAADQGLALAINAHEDPLPHLDNLWRSEERDQGLVTERVSL